MFCSNCGREGKEGELFCGGCGVPKGKSVSVQHVQSVPVQEVPLVNTQVEPAKKKGLPVWAIVLLIIGAVLLAVVVGIIGLFALIFMSFSDYEDDYYVSEQNDNYVYVDKTGVPTIYKVVGEYEMCDSPSYDYYDGIEYITYSYCDDYFDKYVLSNYLDYLVEDYGFEEYEKLSGSRSIKIESEEEGYIVVVKAYIYGEYIEYYKIKEEMIEEDNDI